MTTKNGLIRLYGVASFDRGAKVRWLLTEMDVKFEDHWLDQDENEQESAAFLKLNPMGRIPVAEIGAPRPNEPTTRSGCTSPPRPSTRFRANT